MRDVKPEPVEWLWEPYIPYGKIALIQGDPGDGKTTTAMAIAAAVSSGDALPGGYSTTPADVIVQNAEDGLNDTIVPRLTRFGADVDRVHFIDEDEMALTLSDERIEQSIIEKSAKLCILRPNPSLPRRRQYEQRQWRPSANEAACGSGGAYRLCHAVSRAYE